jgi:hypothetical protein
MGPTTRRRMLALTGVTTATSLAGCLGGGSGDDGGETDVDGGGGGMTQTSGGGGGGDASTTDAGPNDRPDPDCTRLTGQPTPLDVSGTPFIFQFDYVDTWRVPDALQGPGGRSQGLSSPVVSVDGEPESAGIRVGQRFEPLTASGVEESIADIVSGDRNPFSVVRELEYDGETVRVVGITDAELPTYRFWLPDGSEPRQYYPFELDCLTSILRAGGGEPTRTLCVEPTVAAVDTIVSSLEPNPDTTIDEV